MVNAILLRIHQSGHLAELSEERRRFVHEGIAYHTSICERLARGVPFWPLGLASMTDEHLSLGMDCGGTLYVAAWRMEGQGKVIDLPIQRAAGRRSMVRCSFPKDRVPPFSWDERQGILRVALPDNSARIFEIELS